ncbi:YybS family protein [Bacillus manliponensis]|uniref:YybS family protein n=1 Tax=Bacillus manliponensis TaxID=574376 RepID=UPI000B194F1F|nr:YybS family protein [Bacillus manliponensis]
MMRVKSKIVQYWQQPFLGIKHDLMELSPTTKLILTALLSSFAAIFQSAGGYVPGIVFFVSAMTTLPIFLATIVSVRHGFLSYFSTILLLLFIQPSELIIFPFTTGILGLVLGVSFYKSKTRFSVVFLAGASLFMGIIANLFIFRFPVLGSGVGTSFHFRPLLLVAIFSIPYAWIAAEACSFALKRLAHALPNRVIKSVFDQQEFNHLEDDSAKKENVDAKK